MAISIRVNVTPDMIRVACYRHALEGLTTVLDKPSWEQGEDEYEDALCDARATLDFFREWRIGE